MAVVMTADVRGQRPTRRADALTVSSDNDDPWPGRLQRRKPTLWPVDEYLATGDDTKLPGFAGAYRENEPTGYLYFDTYARVARQHRPFQRTFSSRSLTTNTSRC